MRQLRHLEQGVLHVLHTEPAGQVCWVTFEMWGEYFLFELLCRDNDFCNGFPVLFIAQGKLADHI